MTTMTLPNDTTLSAMKEAESGEDAGIVTIELGLFRSYANTARFAELS